MMNNDINSLYPFMMSGSYSEPKIIKGYDSHQKQMHIITVNGFDSLSVAAMEQWVSETFGPKVTGRWNPRWTYHSYSVWHFKYEADAAFFMLRWL